jgi:hypothetical protein
MNVVLSFVVGQAERRSIVGDQFIEEIELSRASYSRIEGWNNVVRNSAVSTLR